MRLKQLEMATGSAGEIFVTCKATGQREAWNLAAAQGWVADLDGEAFNAYYSPGAAPTPDSSLYADLVAAGIEIGSHESDLYFPASPEALAILDRYPLKKSNATRFTNEAPPNVGERWVDVPFAYEPFWNRKGGRK